MSLGRMTCLYSLLDTLDTTTAGFSSTLNVKSNPNFVVWNTTVYASSSCTSVAVVTVVTSASIGAGTRAVLTTAACFTAVLLLFDASSVLVADVDADALFFVVVVVRPIGSSTCRVCSIQVRHTSLPCSTKEHRPLSSGF